MSKPKKPSSQPSLRKGDGPDANHKHILLDFPTGSGNPDCLKCKGRGVVPVMVDIGGQRWPGGGTQDCQCVFKRDLTANVKRVWRVLLNVESTEDSPLLKLTQQNLWITASGYDLRRHLRFVAFRMGTKWDARVIADATLMTAWLSTKKDVYDGDVILERHSRRDRPSEHFLTMVDLVVPFELLIIVLGVKAAANKEMANLLVEAINEREQQGKPTWLVDSPVKPLAPGHLCFNEMVMEVLDGFRRVVISDESHVPVTTVAQKYKRPRAASTASSTSPMSGASDYTRRKQGMVPTAHAPVFKQMPMDDDGERPVEMPEMGDDDEFSVDSLLADAHDPSPNVRTASLTNTPSLDGGTAEVEELLENFPDPKNLGGNANQLPTFLQGPLTKAERLANEKQERREKRWEKNQRSDD